MKDLANKFDLENQTWTHKGFHAVLHTYYAAASMPFKYVKEYFGDSHTMVAYYIHDNICDWYWNNEDMVRLRKLIIKKVNEDDDYLDKLLKEWHKRIDFLNEIINKIDETDLSKLSDEELIDLYEEYFEAYTSEYALACGVQDPFSMHADEYLIPIFMKYVGNNEDIGILLSPVENSFLVREIRDRLKIIMDKNKLKDALKIHAKKYYWIHNNYAVDNDYDEDYFLKEIEKMDVDPDEELKEIDKKLNHLKIKKQELIEKYNLNKELKNYIKITEVFSYMQDERKKYVLIATHYMYKFLREVSKRSGFSFEELQCSNIHELRDVLNGKIDKTLFKKRQTGLFGIHTLKGVEIISGEDAKYIFNNYFEKDHGDINELKGICASPGKVKGRVKIIHKTHDMINMDEGDILFATMTRPEMTVAMKKACAIVTDEGGITSHAAVVSREMKIPCIIGTKIATKIFKDGDEVEVDANNGIIKKIKN